MEVLYRLRQGGLLPLPHCFGSLGPFATQTLGWVLPCPWGSGQTHSMCAQALLITSQSPDAWHSLEGAGSTGLPFLGQISLGNLLLLLLSHQAMQQLWKIWGAGFRRSGRRPRGGGAGAPPHLCPVAMGQAGEWSTACCSPREM